MSPLPTGLARVRPPSPCPICGKGDWCLIAHDRSYAICARTPSSTRAGEAGWRHDLEPRRSPRRRAPLELRPMGPDFRPLALEAEARRLEARPSELPSLSLELGVSDTALRRLSVGWIGWAWSFPMSDEQGRCIGIRLRRPDGKKLAVTGSRQGIFLPTGVDFQRTLFVVEGASDTAAALDLGLEAVGRPSCTGGAGMLIRLVRSRGAKDVVVLADGDQPGRDGAQRLALALCPCVRVRVVEPPAPFNDLRAWRNAGATHDDVAQVVARAVPVRIKAEVAR